MDFVYQNVQNRTKCPWQSESSARFPAALEQIELEILLVALQNCKAGYELVKGKKLI